MIRAHYKARTPPPSVGSPYHAPSVLPPYRYDYRDLRVQSIEDGKTVHYEYDPSGDLLYRSDGSEVRDYIEALGQIWAEVRTVNGTSVTYWHHTDHLGTTELMTDASGKIVWEGGYEAFGSKVRENGSIDGSGMFTGKEYDEIVGLYYFNARWYDPELGRFITEDPARDGENWFAYCGNDPLNNLDPTGLDTCDPKLVAEEMNPGFGNIVLFSWPTAGRITSAYGSRDDAPSPHRGIDIAAPKRGVKGEPVKAAAEGKATLVVSGKRDSDPKGGYGNRIIITHPDGSSTSYGHLDSISPNLKPGSSVKGGQQIGTMGNSGNSTNVHLDFEIRDKDGVPQDPVPLLLPRPKNVTVDESEVKPVNGSLRNKKHAN